MTKPVGFILCLACWSLAAGVAAGDPYEFRVTLGRKGHFPKSVRLGDGIRLKLEDIDHDPLDADFDIRVRYGDHHRKFDLEDVGVGETAAFAFRGSGGAPYDLRVLDIDYDYKTVTVALHRRWMAPPEAPPVIDETTQFESTWSRRQTVSPIDAEIEQIQTEIQTLEARVQTLRQSRRGPADPRRGESGSAEFRPTTQPEAARGGAAEQAEPLAPDRRASDLPVAHDDEAETALRLDMIEKDLAAGEVSIEQYDLLITREESVPETQAPRFHVLVGLYAHRFAERPDADPRWGDVTGLAFERAHSTSADFDALTVCPSCWTDSLKAQWRRIAQRGGK